ncbi:MAG: hypothetical protein KAG84_05190 [Bacteroidales bacterium]|nr:hypothetical protein [Bacteroidales bacterium]
MSTTLNYKSGLLYLYWLMSGADGKKNFDPNDPEWKTMKLMREHEKITDIDFNSFINSDLGSSDEQLEIVMQILQKSSYKEKVRALAWMDLVMIADGDIHNKEYELYIKVLKKFDINDEDVKSDKINLPNII